MINTDAHAYGTVDLTNCDREPIHIPGAIQPHGVLLSVRETDLVVMQASANAGALLGQEVMPGATSLTDLFGSAAAEIRDVVTSGAISSSARAYRAIRAGATDTQWDIVLHRSGGLLIIEIEQRADDSELTPQQFRDVIQRTLTSIEGADTLRAVAAAVAQQMRDLTGFDRVWVYKFHEDWHGEIIGEAKGAGIESWLGLHYPASDIPAQARALFLRNWLRMIPDVSYVPVPLLPQQNPMNGEPLDLGGATLRSASPIHLQYLMNMGVSASLVISLIHRGRLWGLISGHHYSGPKIVGFNMRTICEFLAQALSLQVGLADAVEDRDYLLQLHQTDAELRARIADNTDFREALLNGTPNLSDITCSSGAAICYRGECSTTGVTPSREQIEVLVEWLNEKGDGIFASDALSNVFPPGAAYTTEASGVLAIALSSKRDQYLLWFRQELKQSISWAGDPNKPAVIGSDGEYRLSPRGSFALWEEERLGTSAPWKAAEIRAADDLRRTLLDLQLRKAEELERVNREMSTVNAELEAMNEQLAEAGIAAEEANNAKSDFLAMMSHELRTPLNAIGGYVQLMQMGIRGPTTPEQNEDFARILTSQSHLLGLINNILNFAKLESGQVAFDLGDVNLAAVVDDVVGLVRPQMALRGMSFHRDDVAADVTIHAEAEKVRQILLNLLSNAIKFSADDATISLQVDTTPSHAVIRVRDTGRGIPPDRLATIFDPFVQVDRAHGVDHGVGLGLAISRDLALRMDGDLTVESVPGSGSTFEVTLPLAQG